ncbi:GTP-binding protein [Aspergillus avenaceus]|uniref:GTP-binding protein n=1 Tax=Aspergillus avenaceus TaxID=36643 RepID=A0A5N6TRC4_ASPAV|nr:GTP-binding protein [Aspergillus avenaceus]
MARKMCSQERVVTAQLDHGQNCPPITQIRHEAWMECPPLSQIISELPPGTPQAAPAEPGSLSLEEQETLFCTLQEAIKAAEMRYEGESSSHVQQSTAFEQAGSVFEGVQNVLSQLWKCRSGYMVQATEALANGSRDPLWRLPYGQTGVLTFFLQLVASKDDCISTTLLLHSLRLVGNSCADTDENRTIVVQGNYTSAIIRHLLNPELIQVAIPVIYNICMDFEPAQSQVAVNKIVYILAQLLKEDAFRGNENLLDFVCELIELAAEQEQGIELSPSGTVLLLIELVVDKGATWTNTQFCCLANCLMTYLDHKKFQETCIIRYKVADLLSVLAMSLSFGGKEMPNDEIQAVSQLRLKTNQTLAELSSSALFAEYYPLDSSLSQALKAWLRASDDQLQICSCVMLGNMARSDEVCRIMVREFNIHKYLISILNSDASGPVLHAALGFLKNLAISGDNKSFLGEAGIVPAVSRLWSYETVPQVQFAATSIARQLIVSSVDNVSRLLEHFPSGERQMTYLSQLLSLFGKTDSTPIRTEIGRIISSICRTLIPQSRGQDQSKETLIGCTFSLHEDIVVPITAMITQSQWPVVRSEGWFALALMASNQLGSTAVVHCLEKLGLFSLLDDTLGAGFVMSTEDEANSSQLAKDCDNVIILIQEILKHNPVPLSDARKGFLESLVYSHMSRHLEKTGEN